MITELFNTWEEKWNEIENAWKSEEIHKIGESMNWVYFMWLRDIRVISLIRVDRDTIIEMNNCSPILKTTESKE